MSFGVRSMICRLLSIISRVFSMSFGILFDYVWVFVRLYICRVFSGCFFDFLGFLRPEIPSG